jgi:hypothetical protein
LRACLKAGDDVVGQLANGQFGLCVAGPAEHAMSLGNRVRRALEVPIPVHDHEVLVQASFGLVAVPVPLVGRAS